MTCPALRRFQCRSEVCTVFKNNYNSRYVLTEISLPRLIGEGHSILRFMLICWNLEGASSRNGCLLEAMKASTSSDDKLGQDPECIRSIFLAVQAVTCASRIAIHKIIERRKLVKVSEKME